MQFIFLFIAIALGVWAGSRANSHSEEAIEFLKSCWRWLLILGAIILILIVLGICGTYAVEAIIDYREDILECVLAFLMFAGIIVTIHYLGKLINKIQYNKYKRKGGKDSFEKWQDREKSYNWILWLFLPLPVIIIGSFILMIIYYICISN